MNRVFLLFLLLVPLLSGRSIAAPGAHGPNGEHLDSPGAGSIAALDGRPRMEGYSELFELVAHVEHDRVSVMINVYETNAPVDGATVDLDSDGRTVRAEFDPSTGVYSFMDRELADRLNGPGMHSLAFTIDTGEQFDIVAGALDVAEHEHHDRSRPGLWIAAAAVALALAGLLFHRRRRTRARLSGVRS